MCSRTWRKILIGAVYVLVLYYLVFGNPFPSSSDVAWSGDVSSNAKSVEEDSWKKNKKDLTQSVVGLVEDENDERLESMCNKELGYLPPLRSEPIVILASYPGSGNTWIRHLIQQGTRYLTGSMYNDHSIVKQFPAEGKRDRSVIAVKTHFPCEHCWTTKKGDPVKLSQSGDLKQSKSKQAIVYIIRSPFDCILAEFKRKVGDMHATRFGSRYLPRYYETYSNNHVSRW